MLITGVRTLTQALAAPALSSSVAGSIATLNWSAPNPTGQSVIAGYRVLKSATLGGIYTQVGSNLAANVLTLADTLSGTAFYKVEAFDQFVTGNRSAGQQCVPVTGQRLNFNPSIAYWQLDRNASYQTNFNRMASLKAACPPTRGFEITLTWAAVENPALVGGAAQYDGSWATGDQALINNQRGFKLIDSFIAGAAVLGCQCCIVIRGLGGHSNGGDMSSTNYPSSAAPDYTKSSAYGNVTPATNGQWGSLWVNCYGTPNPNVGSNGVQFQWYIRWWDTRVTALLKAYGAAFGAQYNSNPHVEWFSFAADEMTISDATGYSDSQAINSLTGSTGLLASLRASMPQIPVRVYYNYFDLLATMDTLLAEAVLRDCSVGGPDTCVDKPVVSADPAKNSDGRFRSITALWRWLRLTASAGNGGVTDVNAPIYAGQGDYICEVENEDLAYDTLTNTIISSDGRALGDGIPFNIVATANSLGACRMCWVDNVADGPSTNRTNTAHPNLCDWLSSAAQGGNVNVNGAVAGISLTNTTYPPTWPQ